MIWVGAGARADEWVSAEPLVAVSPNGRWEVHTVVGSADPFRPLSSDRDLFARAMLRDLELGKERAFSLDDPVSPVEILPLDDGSLLTFDHWHNLAIARRARSRATRRATSA